VRFFAPLSNPPFAALLGAITLVELGAHIGNFALIWIAVELIGEEAAYLQSLQFAAVILGAAVGGYLLDDRDPRGVLIGAYLLRASVALCPLIAAWLLGSPLVGLVVAAIGLAIAQSQAEPALQANLTTLTDDPKRRQAANALIFATMRMARLVGRGVPGLLTVLIPVLHLFTLNAVLVALAALLLIVLPRGPRPDRTLASPLRGAFAGARHMLADRELGVFVVTTAFSFAAWAIVVSLGPALIIHGRHLTWLGLPPAACYSLALAVYGLGNLFGTGTQGLSPGIATVFAGQAAFGAGGVLLGLAGALAGDALAMPLILLAIFVAGVGAVGHDLRISNTIQAAGPAGVVSALARARMIVGWSSMCLATLVAPALFNLIGVAPAVGLAGGMMIVVAAWAWWKLR
jgi:MFS transporter, DHA3 family, macrolide efflux protein